MEYGITNNSWTIGNLIVAPSISKVDLVRTPDGVRWSFPVEIHLHGFEGEFGKSEVQRYVRVDGSNDPVQLSWGLRGMAVEMFVRQKGTGIPIARAIVTDMLDAGTGAIKRTVMFPFYLPAQAIAFIENIRQDNDLEVAWQFSAETFWIAMRVFGWRSPQCQSCQFQSGLMVQRVQREPWIAALRELDLSENILVEVPLMHTPDDEWRGVWNSLVAARRSFDKAMWNETVRSVRAAFEAWQTRWREMNKPWKLNLSNGQAHADLDKITKKDRLSDLLYVAKRFADKAAHSTDDDWTRDDALLAISLCTGLWNAIRPNDQRSAP